MIPRQPWEDDQDSFWDYHTSRTQRDVVDPPDPPLTQRRKTKLLGHEAALHVLTGLLRAIGEADIEAKAGDPVLRLAAEQELEAFLASLETRLPWSSEITGYPVESGGVLRRGDLDSWAKVTPGVPADLAVWVFALVGEPLTARADPVAAIEAVARSLRDRGTLTRASLIAELVRRVGGTKSAWDDKLRDEGGVRRIYQSIGHTEKKTRPAGLKYRNRQE